MGKVYVRDFETRSIIKEIEVHNDMDSSRYDQFATGLLRNMDLDKFYLDDDAYLKVKEKENW